MTSESLGARTVYKIVVLLIALLLVMLFKGEDRLAGGGFAWITAICLSVSVLLVYSLVVIMIDYKKLSAMK